MRVKGSVARILASTLIVMFPLAAMPPAIAASGGAAISGTVFSASSSTPLAGARLFLKDPATGASYVSSVSGADGAFDAVSVPASSYRVAIEADGALYVVDAPVTVPAGSSRHLRVAIREAGRGRGGRADSEMPDSDKKKEEKDTSFWSNPLTATLIVVGGAILVGVIVDQATNDDDQAASAFAP